MCGPMGNHTRSRDPVWPKQYYYNATIYYDATIFQSLIEIRYEKLIKEICMTKMHMNGKKKKTGERI